MATDSGAKSLLGYCLKDSAAMTVRLWSVWGYFPFPFLSRRPPVDGKSVATTRVKKAVSATEVGVG
jgi:hypothetical protein